MNRKKSVFKSPVFWLIVATVVICAVLAAVLLTPNGEPPTATQSPELTSPTPSPAPSASPAPVSPSPEPSPSAAPDSPQPSPSAKPSPSPKAEPDLEALELFFNSVPANGMLCSEYADVRSANMRELLYQCSDESVPFSEVYNAYKDEFGSVETDITYMSSAVFDELLTSLTGYGLDEDWNFDEVEYLAAADVYCVQHGDTNHSPVKCAAVKDLGDGLYAVTCRSPHEGGELACRDENGEYCFVTELIVTVRAADGGYQFVSNEIAD